MKITNRKLRVTDPRTLVQLCLHIAIATVAILGLIATPIRPQSLWQDHNHYSQLKYKVGDVLFVNIEEVIVSQFEFRSERGKKTKLFTNPTKASDFFPTGEHSETFQGKGLGKMKNNGKIITTVAVRIVGKDADTDSFQVKGTKSVQYGDQFHSLSLEGVIDPTFAQDHRIMSSHVADLKLVLSGAPVQKLRNDIGLDAGGNKDIRQEDKEKILLDYFKRYFGEMQ